jgi:hypothetical protein
MGRGGEVLVGLATRHEQGSDDYDGND